MPLDQHDPEDKVRDRPKKLGELLVTNKTINSDQLKKALAEQKRLNQNSRRKFKLGEVLLFLKYIAMNQLHSTLLHQRPRSAEATAKLQRLKEINRKALDEWLEKKTPAATESKASSAKPGLFNKLKNLM